MPTGAFSVQCYANLGKDNMIRIQLFSYPPNVVLLVLCALGGCISIIPGSGIFKTVSSLRIVVRETEVGNNLCQPA